MKDKKDKRTTIIALVGIAVWLLAKKGFEVPAEIREYIIFAVIGALGWNTADKPRRPKPPTQKGQPMLKKVTTLALFVAMLLMAVMTSACDRSQLQRAADASAKIINVVEVNRDVPASLERDGLITHDVRLQLDTAISEVQELGGKLRDGLRAALSTENPNLAQFAPLVADIIQRVNVLRAANHPQLSKLLTGTEVSLRVVATFFATQMNHARAFYQLSDQDLCARLGIAIRAEQIALIENYAWRESGS